MGSQGPLQEAGKRKREQQGKPLLFPFSLLYFHFFYKERFFPRQGIRKVHLTEDLDRFAVHEKFDFFYVLEFRQGIDNGVDHHGVVIVIVPP